LLDVGTHLCQPNSGKRERKIAGTQRKELLMFTRIVNIEAKQGKAKELCQTIEDKVLPTMRKLHGFKDEV
jgi:hypothetical protein